MCLRPTDLHASLDNVQRRVSEHGSRARHHAEHSSDDLGHRLVDVVLAAVQFLHRLHHEEANRLVRALLHHGCSETLVCPVDTCQRTRNRGSVSIDPYKNGRQTCRAGAN